MPNWEVEAVPFLISILSSSKTAFQMASVGMPPPADCAIVKARDDVTSVFPQARLLGIPATSGEVVAQAESVAPATSRTDTLLKSLTEISL
jgi:hypothetical protein